MKELSAQKLPSCALGLALLSGINNSGEYRLEWSAFAEGLSVSTEAAYELVGAFGIDGIDNAEGASYSLLPGVWYSSPSSAPRLQILADNQRLRVSWMLTSAQLVLEQTDSLEGPLSSINWSESRFDYQTIGSEIFVTVPAAERQRYFRLIAR